MMQIAGYAYARLGRHDDARKMIGRLKELEKSEYVINYFVATIYAGLGDKEAAFVELQKAEREGDWRMTSHIKADFMLDEMRSDARFKELLRRLNLGG